MKYKEDQVFVDMNQLVNPKNIQILFSRLAFNPVFEGFFKFHQEVNAIIPRLKKRFKAYIGVNDSNEYYIKPVFDKGLNLEKQKWKKKELVLLRFPIKGFNYITQCTISHSELDRIYLNSVDPRYYERFHIATDAEAYVLSDYVVQGMLYNEIRIVQKYLASGQPELLKGSLFRDYFYLSNDKMESTRFSIVDKEPLSLVGAVHDISCGGLCIRFPHTIYNQIQNASVLYVYSKNESNKNILYWGKVAVIRSIRQTSSVQEDVLCHCIFPGHIHQESIKYLSDIYYKYKKAS